VTSDELGLDKPGALARYFAERWLEKPSSKGEQIIAWLLEAALGKNAMYFIEKTKEYVDAWGGSGEVVPANAFDDFVITGDPVEDTLIPHAVLVWTCMNDRSWPEEVYHRWLDSLLAAGSAEAAYLAASLWPAHDLMGKVTYRPPGWLVYRGQLDAEMERLILMEMLKRYDEPRTSLYGSFEYDDLLFPSQLLTEYIERHGFTHPICGLIDLRDLDWDNFLKKYIQEVLAAPSWSEGTKGAMMLLYLFLKALNKSSARFRELLNTLEQNLFKLDEKHINIINFHMDKTENIDYNLIKDYINYLIILYNKTINKSSFSTKIFSKYISVGLKTKDIYYIGKYLNDIIFGLMLKEREKVESWLEKQEDDLRIKDIFLATYMTKRIDYLYFYTISILKELKNEQIEKKIEDIHGKIKYTEKIKLLIDQARIYFNKGDSLYKICRFINNILKREGRINFGDIFIKDYAKIIHSWHPNRGYFSKKDVFLDSNHLGLYLYYEILMGWGNTMIDFADHINKEKELKVHSKIKKKIIENLYGFIISDTGTKINLYLNKIENNNFPCEEIKYELIIKLINIIENNYNNSLEYLKDEKIMIKVREIIMSNIYSLMEKLRDSILIGLLGIDNKQKNMIIY